MQKEFADGHVRGQAPLTQRPHIIELDVVADSSEAQVASSAIQSALLRGLAGFKGIAVLDPSELRNVVESPATIAATVSADEVVSASVESSRDEWHVHLRWTTRHDTVRWTDEFAVPRDDPLILANAVIATPNATPPARSQRKKFNTISVASHRRCGLASQ